MNQRLKIILPIWLLALLLNPAIPMGNEEGYEQHGQHVHGAGELQVVLEKQVLQIEFHIPAMSMVGFEHSAETTQQEQAIEKVIAYLKSASHVMSLSSDAQCQLQSSDAKLVLEQIGTDDHAQEEHGENDDEEEAQKGGHAEFQSRYHFLCTRPEKLSKIELRLFQEFQGIQTIQASLIMPNKQTSQELSPKKFVILLVECRFNLGSWCIF